jgi:hypothetical protein
MAKKRKDEKKAKFNEARKLGAADIACAFYAEGRSTLEDIKKNLGK